MNRIASYFQLAERGTTVPREILGGATTFTALSYIVFVQPGVLSAAGMDFGAVMTATCISSAIAMFLMGFLANYPIGLAPGMGHNFFFAFTLCGSVATGGFGLTWEQALAAVFVSGAVFLALSVVGFRSAVLNSVPAGLKAATVAGIGLFIAFIGLQYGNIVVARPGTLLGFGDFSHPVTLLTLAGLVGTGVLFALRIGSAILLGMLGTLVVGILSGQIEYSGLVSSPASVQPTAFQFDFGGLFSLPFAQLFTLLFVLFFFDLFDTIGTLIGVCKRADLLEDDGSLARGERALFADAAGTVVGAALGTSTVTSYIESASGVSNGARTGLAAITTGLFMLAALFFGPLAEMIGGGIQIGTAETGAPILKYPIIAPALILVGCLMMQAAAEVHWEDPTESLPAFLTIIGMPFSFSIADGLALGFVSFAILKLVTGRYRECPLLIYICAPIFCLKYVLV